MSMVDDLGNLFEIISLIISLRKFGNDEEAPTTYLMYRSRDFVGSFLLSFTPWKLLFFLWSIFLSIFMLMVQLAILVCIWKLIMLWQ